MSFQSAALALAAGALLSSCDMVSFESADWKYATSAAVLGVTVAELEKRLGKADHIAAVEGDHIGGIIYNIGDCEVVYNFRDNKIAWASVKLDQRCKGSYAGVESLKNTKFGPDTTFETIPASLLGTWHGTGGPTSMAVDPVHVLFI